MEKLNSTGSFKIDDNGNYWSYDTQMTETYKGHLFVNKTRYSETTSKHQSKLPFVDKLHKLYFCSYGALNIEKQLKIELKYIDKEIEYRKTKRQTNKNKEAIKQLEAKLNFFNNILFE